MHIFETEFPSDFRKEEIQKILDYATTGKFCQLVCIPGVGKATILRLLAHNRQLLKFHLGEKEKSLRFVYLNFFELTDFAQFQIIKFILVALDEKPQSQDDELILTKQLHESVNKLAEQDQTVIFLFDHFDEHQNRLPRSFFQLLKSLRALAKYEFATVFATRRDLVELVDPQILKDYWDFFVGNTVYLKIFDNSANNYMFEQIEKVFGGKLTDEQKTKITRICGGHAKLTKIASELVLGQKTEPEMEFLLANQQMQAALYEIWLFLTGEEQHQLYTISKGQYEKDFTASSLINFNLITQKSEGNFAFTIPIFEKFVQNILPGVHQEIAFNPQNREITKGKSSISGLLSPQEFKLLKFLIENEGKIVERDEIIPVVWKQAQTAEAISDEAIDQMVFRLRKKIEDDPKNPKYILTVKGRGLKFES